VLAAVSLAGAFVSLMRPRHEHEREPADESLALAVAGE
jgi:hypothetical protein